MYRCIDTSLTNRGPPHRFRIALEDESTELTCSISCTSVHAQRPKSSVAEVHTCLCVSDHSLSGCIFCRKRSVGDEWSRLIKEKDEQIAQLMEEGTQRLHSSLVTCYRNLCIPG